ncbi:MAG: hypothetical protein HY304_05840 [candidate division Zixibacteria bacterium]|nr:hypothetical protein [candidate division Zixibacteria bacterium]
MGLAANPSSAWADGGPSTQTRWFNPERTPELVATLVVVLAMIGAAIWTERRGLPHIRRLAPLEAIDDAVGAATEQGTPLLFTTGWGGDMGRPTTMAAMTVLSHVAGRAAEHNCPLVFPSHDPVVASVAEDTIRQAAARAGRPDWAHTAEARFVSQSQFGYAAAVDGLIARQRPGAVFLLGSFEGEALVLAEAAHQSGTRTISGTDSTIQLSFFLVACDYTLIGEELFIAADVLSGGRAAVAVRALDWLKYLILLLLVAGVLLLVTTGRDLGPFLAR